MLKKQFRDLVGPVNKSTLVSIILVVNAFVWYYTVLVQLQAVITDVLIWGVHFTGLILSALIGASLAKKIERSKLLVFWMSLGITSSLVLFAINNTSTVIIGLIALLLGVSLGLGMPTCMSYYTDCVPVENRGRVSGITMLITGLGIFAFGTVLVADVLIVSVVLSVWRLSSLLIFVWAKSLRGVERKKGFSSYKSIFSQQSFVLYFVPWVMFSLVNYIAVPFQLNPEAAASNVMLIQISFMGIFAVLGGFFIDFVGRKRIAIAGFALLGLGTAVTGLSSTGLSSDIYISYFNAIIDGVAWGFLLVLFVLTLWGDLSYSSSSEKFYALGVLPFFASRFIELTVSPYIMENIQSSTALFSITAFFLFLAVLPLVYAPETLPEKITQKKQLESYVEKAQKVAQKDAEKSQNKNPDKAEKGKEEPEETPEDEEARKLAEKYY
jgi:MFS family permease